MKAAVVKNELKEISNPEKAKSFLRFFKTDKGQYSEGDKFLGATVPKQRKIAKNHYKEISLANIKELLGSDFHEHRLTALFMLVYKFEKSDEIERQKIFNFYLKNKERVNNWDLVDSSVQIIGKYLSERNDRAILYSLAVSKNLWDKRIAIISTYDFIKNNQFEDTIKISRILLHDKHDLIHKAVGWMLRELGKRDLKTEKNFLKKYYKEMPRAMLRYAVEKFPERERKKYLAGEV
ncbi:DNA alkylation repair protein [Candidatus Dojkabacteria bacterium]|nr:DNA alkylation repair protein [Candidatus Dojkabacteria bacterium]